MFTSEYVWMFVVMLNNTTMQFGPFTEQQCVTMQANKVSYCQHKDIPQLKLITTPQEFK